MQIGFGGADGVGGSEHFVGLGEEGFVFGEEGEQGLAEFDAVAQLGVDFEAGVSADGVSGFGAAGTETLDGPAYFGAVHRGEKACGFGGEDAGGFGFVEGGWIGFAFEKAGVAALGSDDFEEGLEGETAA